MVDPDIIAAAKAWAEQDPDPETKGELEALIASGSEDLRERFAGPLAFGTAGLRGLLGAGETRMNRAVVRRTSAGLAGYLLEHQPHVKTRGVIVGFDGRRQSDVFARETAAVLCAAGIPVHLSDKLCPTPIVAYAVKELGAAAGVMITASHNPPRYNGYKVYADNGAQIIPPSDRLIAAAIAEAGPASAVAVADLDQARADGLLHSFGNELDRSYLDAVRGLSATGSGDRSLGIVYTPLHGVGAPLLTAAMAEACFEHLHVVPEQREPDGAFPTVAFPNPEEEGALDLSFALAREHDAALVIANDPDADRLAVAVRASAGSYVQLTGNELGVLLGHYLLTREPGAHRLVIASLVSSPQLGVIARELGVRYEETLTGFKWISNRAMQLERDAGLRFVFGYEEALGYTVGTLVRDKDGISAALVLATLAAELHAQGETLLDELERIGRRFGYYQSQQRSLHFPGAAGPDQMRELMAQLRQTPPTTLGQLRVSASIDVLDGTRRAAGGTTPVELPASDVLVFELEGGHRVIVRPSGTEPKMKIYFDVREDLAEGERLDAARARASQRIDLLRVDVLARLGID